MILITGATGLSGHFVVLELQRRGDLVRELARASSTDKLAALGVDVAMGDLARPSRTWRQAVANTLARANEGGGRGPDPAQTR